MAVRTTAAAVEAIIEVDETIALSDGSGLDPFIEAGNLVVNRVVATATKADGTLYYTDDAELEIIERWLSAHFYAVRDPRIQFDGVKSLMTRYETFVRLNLNNTRYGQQALVLDTSGRLGKFNKDLEKGGKRKVGLHWLGIPPQDSEVI